MAIQVSTKVIRFRTFSSVFAESAMRMLLVEKSYVAVSVVATRPSFCSTVRYGLEYCSNDIRITARFPFKSPKITFWGALVYKITFRDFNIIIPRLLADC